MKSSTREENISLVEDALARVLARAYEQAAYANRFCGDHAEQEKVARDEQILKDALFSR